MRRTSFSEVIVDVTGRNYRRSKNEIDQQLRRAIAAKTNGAQRRGYNTHCQIRSKSKIIGELLIAAENGNLNVSNDFARKGNVPVRRD